MKKERMILVFCMVLYQLLSLQGMSQKKKFVLKDSVDKKLDLSDYIIDASGFVPVPIIITEPALGGFGGGVVPVFIKKRRPYSDSVKGKLVRTPIAPDITGAMAAYTLNNTWMLGAFRSGTFVKSRIKYMAGAGYASVNMSFYRTGLGGNEREFAFNFKTAGGMLQATKRLGFSHWYAGLKYLFIYTDVSHKGDTLLLPPDLKKTGEYNSNIASLSGIVELDNRDNVFTPDQGEKVHVDVQRSDNIFGSDYEYWRINYYMYLYRKIIHNITGGWRIDGQQVLGDAPFFLLPFIDMRGIGAARYQGKADILTEIETRWDITKRWSLVFFGGTGKAFNDWKDFGSSEWIYSYGTGFRYLLARKFKLRMGADIAKGPPGSWGYYLVFGSSWLK